MGYTILRGTDNCEKKKNLCSEQRVVTTASKMLAVASKAYSKIYIYDVITPFIHK